MGDVQTFSFRVTVNGVERFAKSVSLTKEIAGDLPDQAVVGSGISGADGSITWAPQGDVETRSPSPWHDTVWPPRPGDRVVVFASDGVRERRRFTGVIDRTTGSVGGEMQSSIIDDRDRMTGTVSHEPLLRHHVPYLEGGPYRSIGLESTYLLNHALRRCGIATTPLLASLTALSIPLQGSSWAEAGTVTASTGGPETITPVFYHSPWGMAASNLNLECIPRLSEPITSPVQIGLMVAPDSSGRMQIVTKYASSDPIILRIVGRRVFGMLGGSVVVDLTLSGDATRVSLLVAEGTWTLSSDSGQRAESARVVSGGAMTAISVGPAPGFESELADMRVAGLVVDHPGASVERRQHYVTSPLDARVRPGFLAPTMDMMPAIRARDIPTLVAEITTATLTAVWWDEDGVLQVAGSDVLANADPVETVTTLDDITSLTWLDSLQAARSQVEVAWRKPVVSKGKYRTKELWRAADKDADGESEFEHIVTPEAGEEWFGVDRVVRHLTMDNLGAYNRGTGSYFGGFGVDDSGAIHPQYVPSLSYRPLQFDSLIIEIKAPTLPPAVEMVLGTPDDPVLWPHKRNEVLPVVRGFGHGGWADQQEVAAGGPSWAPVLRHELGVWGQEFFDGTTCARRVADWIMRWVKRPVPVITDMGVTPSPARRVGDVITIESGLLGVTLTALIVGMSESISPSSWEQALTVRIISATLTEHVTYGDLAEAWQGGDYTSLQAAWAALSYGDFATDPLEGSPK